MKNLFLHILFILIMNGVFGSETNEVKKVSVLEGDPVTLHTGVAEIQRVYLIWMYGSESSIIAKFDGSSQAISFYDVDDGRFEDRLQLDNQTGSLTIRDIRNKHAGDYKLKIISSESIYKTFSVTVHDVFFAGIQNKKEGDSITLHTGVTEIQKYVLILWMFGPVSPETFVAEINITIHKISYSDDERFRDRLQLDHQTGSLIIRDIRTTDSGLYQLQISSSKETFYKRFNVFVAVPDPGVSPGVIAGICAFVLLVLAAVAGVIYYRRRYFRLKDEIKSLSVTEGESVTLNTGITELQNYDTILWKFGPRGYVIAKVNIKTNKISYGDDERFKDRLQLNSQTGDLSICDIRITHSGDYTLQLSSSRGTKTKSFRVVLCADTLRLSEGDSITLNTDVTKLQKDEQILWRFGTKDTLIAKTDGQIPLDNVECERFKDRLQLKQHTGSLIITNCTIKHSGVYQLQIRSPNKISYKNFGVTVWFDTLKVSEGDSVTLNTDVTELQQNDKILWTCGDKDTSIAEINRATNKISVYNGNYNRFRDRLQLDPQTGSLTITNISKAHSDIYKLQINGRKEPIFKRFMVIAQENTVSVKEGDSVTLHTDVTEIQKDAVILWTFGTEHNLIVKSNVEDNKVSTYDDADGRFRDRLQLGHQTGSLTIRDTRPEHTGLYQLHIISSKGAKYKKFRVTVHENRGGERIREESVIDQEGVPLLHVDCSQKH